MKLLLLDKKREQCNIYSMFLFYLVRWCSFQEFNTSQRWLYDPKSQVYWPSDLLYSCMIISVFFITTQSPINVFDFNYVFVRGCMCHECIGLRPTQVSDMVSTCLDSNTGLYSEQPIFVTVLNRLHVTSFQYAGRKLLFRMPHNILLAQFRDVV